MSHARRTTSGWLLCVALVGCGGNGETALQSGDPLHDKSIGLPPPVRWQKPPAPETAALIRVPPPPFSEGIFPCSRCHDGGPAPAPDTAPTVTHAFHLEQDLECADCHAPDDPAADPLVPDSSLCFECHEDLDESAGVKAFFARIKQADGSYRFTRRWQTRDVIANHGAHAAAKVGCEECHGAPSNAPFAKPKSVALMDRCVACHQERGKPAECETCHTEIREPQHHAIKLNHAEEQRGCLDCHHPDDRDVLRLVNGTSVPFAESYRLCGQCHGPKLRDWKLGLHGKRTGMWDGAKQYLLCVHCHTNPHAPQIPPMRPDPPPMRPENVR